MRSCFLLILPAAFAVMSCVAFKESILESRLNEPMPEITAPMDTTPERIVPYEEARLYYYDVGSTSPSPGSHLDWKSYRKHPMTVRELGEEVRRRGSLPVYTNHTGRRNFFKGSNRKYCYGGIKNADGASWVMIGRRYFFNHDAFLYVSAEIKLLENATGFSDGPYRLMKACIVYWTDDGVRHEEPLDMEDCSFSVTRYNPLLYTLSGKFRFGKSRYCFSFSGEPDGKEMSMCRKLR